MSERDWEEAGRLLDRCVQLNPQGSILRSTVAPMVAFFEAAVRRDPTQALPWLAECRGAFVVDAERLLAESAILAAEGRRAEARSCIQRTRESMQNLSGFQLVAAPIVEMCLTLVEEELDADAPALAT